jgi:tetratricopeptide (TPR) repeat protein
MACFPKKNADRMIRLVLLLVFVCCFTLATMLAPAFEALQQKSGRSSSPLLALVGDSRRLFANQFFIMADVYFHSGYYPTIFDEHKTESPSHLDVASHEQPGQAEPAKKEPDDDDHFLATPKDWIERFGRNFFPTVHTHLEGKKAQEILPWLKLSADMDPSRIDTYVTTSYWLRTRLNKAREAEQFLREGLRANPDSYEILLELGRVYYYNENNPRVARNLWEAALAKWRQQDQARLDPNPRQREQILGELVRDDERSGDLKKWLADLEALKQAVPQRTSLDKQIADVKARMAH